MARRKAFTSPPLPPPSLEEIQAALDRMDIKHTGIKDMIFAIAGETATDGTTLKFKRAFEGSSSNTTFVFALVRLLCGDPRIGAALDIPGQVKAGLLTSIYGEKQETMSRFAVVLDAVWNDPTLRARVEMKLRIMETEFAQVGHENEESDA